MSEPVKSMRRIVALLVLGLGCVPGMSAHSQEGDPAGTVTLVAAPRLVDPDYRGAVLLAVPVDNNRHVGVIINRPTGRSRRMKHSRRAALLALLALATAAFAQGSAKAVFLIARPGMPDPNFRETVVLVAQEEGAEATGVVVNRPTNRSLAELLPSERF